MTMIKIYCEDGSMTKDLKSLGKEENVTLISFPFENRNKCTTDATKPSRLTCDSTFFTADNNKVKISDTVESDKYDQIKQIIGKQNLYDVRHFDTAYKEGCQIFVTPDKKDIVSKANELYELTGIRVFHCEDIESIIECYVKL